MERSQDEWMFGTRVHFAASNDPNLLKLGDPTVRSCKVHCTVSTDHLRDVLRTFDVPRLHLGADRLFSLCALASQHRLSRECGIIFDHGCKAPVLVPLAAGGCAAASSIKYPWPA
jgi:hypothetical protein